MIDDSHVLSAATQTLTIYNRWRDAESRIEHWLPTVIEGTTWLATQGTGIAERGLTGNDYIRVRIPEGRLPTGMVTPAAYALLDDATGYWTLQAGDVLVRGPFAQYVENRAALTAMENSFVITSIRDNRRGPSLRHILVEGR